MNRIKLLLIVLCMMLIAVPVARAGGDPMTSIVDRTLVKWPQVQFSDGSFPDYVNDFRLGNRSGSYKAPSLAYALLARGMKSNNSKLWKSGLLALNSSLRTIHSDPGPLGNVGRYLHEDLPLVEIWRCCQARLPQESRDQLRKHLQNIQPDQEAWLDYLPENQSIIERTMILELLSTAIPPDAETTGSDRVLSHPQQAHDLALNQLKKEAAFLVGEQKPAEGGLLGDMPWAPLSYQALSTAMLARSVGFLDASESAPLKSAVLTSVRSMIHLAGPDGEWGWGGRSSQEAWGLSMAAYSARRAANWTSAAEAGLFYDLASRLSKRLQSHYFGSSTGLWIIPALRGDLAQGEKALDSYAASVVYSGLAAMGMQWAAEEKQGTARPLPASSRVFNRGDNAQYASVLTGNSFVAARGADAGSNNETPLNDSGVFLAKAKMGGHWKDLLAGRPHLWSPQRDVGGPSIIKNEITTPPRVLKIIPGKNQLQLVSSYGALGVRTITIRGTNEGCSISIPLKPGEQSRMVFWVPGQATAKLWGAIWPNGYLKSNSKLMSTTVPSPATASYSQVSMVRLRVYRPSSGTATVNLGGV